MATGFAASGVIAMGGPLCKIARRNFLMWGGTQAALGDVGWIVNRLAPTLGVLVLLASLAMVAAVPGRLRSYGRETAQTAR